MAVKTGCAGFPVSRERYFEFFRVVEVQKTFYDLPRPSTVERWRNEAPSDFEYTLKAWQLITHEPSSPTYRRLSMKIQPSREKNYGSFRPTEEVFRAWEETKEVARILGARVVLIQCPASFRPTDTNIKNLKKFFSTIERDGFIFAWEPRGRWEPGLIKGLCKDLGLVHAVDPFLNPSVYGRITYYRLHGIGGYRYRFTDRDLERLKKLLPRRKDSYIIFNNVYMFDDAVRFKSMLEG